MTILVDGELVLYGFVGEDFWDEGFTATQVIDALAMLGRDADITVRINSGGGYTDDGIAIYNALQAHRGEVAVVVEARAEQVLPDLPADCRRQSRSGVQAGDRLDVAVLKTDAALDRQNARTLRCAEWYDQL
jgi:hypothetical protein